MAALTVEHLRKSYRQVEALKGVSLEVAKGEVYGLLGQNGAGKSTLIKILLGIVKPSGGSAVMLGHDAGHVETRARVGYLPEDHRFPDYHTGNSLLRFYGDLYGVPPSRLKVRIGEVLEMVGIAGRADSKIRTYSKGMKQRLGVAQALMHDPELIILDEPTDGVDPIGRSEIRDAIRNLKASGVTVFLNSHLLGEVEQICDRVAILQRGEKVREGTIAELTHSANRYSVGLAPGETFPEELATELGATIAADGALWKLVVPADAIDRMVSGLSASGRHLRHLVEKRLTLEEVFLGVVDSSEPGVDRRRRRGGETR